MLFRNAPDGKLRPAGHSLCAGPRQAEKIRLAHCTAPSAGLSSAPATSCPLPPTTRQLKRRGSPGETGRVSRECPGKSDIYHPSRRGLKARTEKCKRVPVHSRPNHGDGVFSRLPRHTSAAVAMRAFLLAIGKI